MRGEKVANAICTRPEPGSSLRDGRHPPLSGLPGVTAMQLQNSRVLAAASEVLAALRENADEAVWQAACSRLRAAGG